MLEINGHPRKRKGAMNVDGIDFAYKRSYSLGRGDDAVVIA